MVKNDFRQAKITFWSPYLSTRHWLRRNRAKKRFSASENHFLEPLSLHKAPALEDDVKNDFRQAKITFWSPYPSTRHRPWRKMVKNDFRQAKITFWSPCPSTRHQPWRKMVKNDFRQAKITFWSPCPSTRHQPWRKMVKNDFRQAKITFWSPYLSTRHWLRRNMAKKTIFGKRKSLFGAFIPPQGTSSGG